MPHARTPIQRYAPRRRATATLILCAAATLLMAAGVPLGNARANTPDLSAAKSPTGKTAGQDLAPDWNACRATALNIERQHQIPQALLAAVARAESGRPAPTGTMEAWPWTINVEGRGQHFATKEQAVLAVRRLLAKGIRTIDVGCMQVNLRFHPRAFTSLEEAFDPTANIAYGAHFLRQLRSQSGTWERAIAKYHSYTPHLSTKYTSRVLKVWERERRDVARIAQTMPERLTVLLPRDRQTPQVIETRAEIHKVAATALEPSEEITNAVGTIHPSEPVTDLVFNDDALETGTKVKSPVKTNSLRIDRPAPSVVPAREIALLVDENIRTYNP